MVQTSGHLVVPLEAVHLGQQLQQALLPLLAAAVEAAAARLADGVDLVCGRCAGHQDRFTAHWAHRQWCGLPPACTPRCQAVPQTDERPWHPPMKRMEGATLRAARNSERMRAAAMPWNISTNSAPFALKKGTPDSPAMALARYVLPVPGGPSSRMPCSVQRRDARYTAGSSVAR